MLLNLIWNLKDTKIKTNKLPLRGWILLLVQEIKHYNFQNYVNKFLQWNETQKDLKYYRAEYKKQVLLKKQKQKIVE